MLISPFMSPGAYERYVSATGATLDEDTGLLRLTTSQYDNLESMTFTIGGTAYTFTANAQIWPVRVSAIVFPSCQAFQPTNAMPCLRLLSIPYP